MNSKTDAVEVVCAVFLDEKKQAEQIFISMGVSRPDFDSHVEGWVGEYKGGVVMVPITFTNEGYGGDLCNVMRSLIILDEALEDPLIEGIFARFFKAGFEAGRNDKGSI